MLEQIHEGDITPEEYVQAGQGQGQQRAPDGLRPPRLQELRPAGQDAGQRWRSKLLAPARRQNDPLLDIARRLEEIALEDPYFVERKLYPNVDFYSGIILRAIGIPTNMFTVMFAIGRLPGWIAHWWEQNQSAANRIARPRQIYTGNPLSDYVDMDKRG